MVAAISGNQWQSVAISGNQWLGTYHSDRGEDCGRHLLGCGGTGHESLDERLDAVTGHDRVHELGAVVSDPEENHRGK